MILYFSGTGNSRYTARKIAEKAGAQPGQKDQLIDLNSKVRNHDTQDIDSGSELVFVVPTYAWRIPKVVRQWILDTRFIGAKKAWFVMTCGDEIGNASRYNKQLCEEKNWKYMGTGQVIMPENYLAMFAVPKPSTAEKIILNAEPAIDAIAKRIAEGQSFRGINTAADHPSAVDRLKSSLINPVFYAMFVKADAFYAKESCISCGKCASVCPLNNISIADGRPVWGKNCTHCMACISYCPAEAIEYGKKSIGKPRYHI